MKRLPKSQRQTCARTWDRVKLGRGHFTVRQERETEKASDRERKDVQTNLSGKLSVTLWTGYKLGKGNLGQLERDEISEKNMPTNISCKLSVTSGTGYKLGREHLTVKTEKENETEKASKRQREKRRLDHPQRQTWDPWDMV